MKKCKIDIKKCLIRHIISNNLFIFGASFRKKTQITYKLKTIVIMEKYGKIIQASILAVGLLLLGLCIKSGIDNFTNKDRRVTVKGLAEQVVDADKVTWTLSVTGVGDNLDAIFAMLNNQVATIQKYLKESGIDGKAKITINSFSITDNEANVWSERRPTHRYSVTRSMNISSTDTKFISEVKEKAADALLERGVMIDSNYANYEYTKFQELKPQMMSEAIAAAEKTAQQFAENSHSTINKIVEAGQGEFSIDEADIAYQKKVRVVSTITYSLKD